MTLNKKKLLLFFFILFCHIIKIWDQILKTLHHMIKTKLKKLYYHFIKRSLKKKNKKYYIIL